jgi:hypothetical protein
MLNEAELNARNETLDRQLSDADKSRIAGKPAPRETAPPRADSHCHYFLMKALG